MTITIPKLALVLAVLFGVWWLFQPHEPPAAEDPTGASAGLDPAMRARLELAVTSAANAAECGRTEVGYGSRTPAEAVRHLVALMASASAPLPGEQPTGGPGVEYVIDRPTGAWQVAVRVDAEGNLAIDGYGADLERPLFSRRVPCS
jgi:hypothetical protein